VKNDKPKEEQSVLQSDPMNYVQKLLTDCYDIIKRSSQSLFSVSKGNRKKCHMLPAKAVLYDSSNVKLFALRNSVHTGFHKEVELLTAPEFRIKCKIESLLLSSDTKYKCYLVYKISEKCRGLHYPVRVRDQRH
nr:serine/threonine-protein kinase, active site protein [Tanacetum cinerariifolium]